MDNTTYTGKIPAEMLSELAKALEATGSSSKVELSYRERRHISKIKMDQYEDVKYVPVGSWATADFGVPLSERYIAATDLTFSLLASLYDVNSSKLIAYNIFADAKPCISGFGSFIKPLKRPNIEARLIGLQNGSDKKPVEQIMEFLIKRGIPLVEADLFGNEVRHIAFDAKQGMSFNVLVNNMNYRPGELVNKMTIDQFERSLKQASSQK